jgi:hypothetical protein
MTFFATQPLWLAALCLIVLPTLLGMAGPILIRRFVTLDKLRTNNEVAGFKFATVGVLYAVLLAFAVVVVWEKFSECENVVAQEAGAAASLYRLADGLDQDVGVKLHDQLTIYLKSAIDDEWPALAQGRASREATKALDDLYRPILAFKPADLHGSQLQAEVLHQLDQLTDARRTLVVAAPGVVPIVLWMALFSGAIVTIGFTFFFGTENLWAQALMTGALGFLIWSGMLIIITIDHPFVGTVQVTPEALSVVMEDFGGQAPS